MTNSVIMAVSFMLFGVLCFEFIPTQLLGIFSTEATVLSIGENAFRIIGISFIPAVFSLISPVFFQAIGSSGPSVLLSLTRQIFCLIPIFWVLSFMGLEYTWFAFPIAEFVTGSVGWLLYRRKLKQWNFYDEKQTEINKGDIRMKLITAIINRKDVGEVCTSLTEAGYYFTKMMSSGGFLTSGNTTLIIGTEKDKV